MMTLYPSIEKGETHRLQHVAEVRLRLEKERDFRASLYKKYRRGANFADGLDTALSVTSVGLAATGVGPLSTMIAAPVATGIGVGTIVCGLLGAVGKLAGRRLQAKARKHYLIRGLAESKLNTIADRISIALNDDKITEEEFRLILSEVDKLNQMKAEIRGRQKQSSGLSEDEKNRLLQRARDEAMIAACTKLLKEIQAGTSSGWLVVLGLTALCDIISVFVRPSSRDREKEKRNDTREQKRPNNPHPHLLHGQQAPALLKSKLVGRPGTGSSPSTIAPPDHSQPAAAPEYFLLASLKHSVLRPVPSWQALKDLRPAGSQ